MNLGLKPRVLIIDNNPQRTQQLKNHLEQHEFNVKTAPNPTAALHHLQSHMVLVINPPTQPENLTFIHTFKTKHPPLKILLYSDNANSKERIRGLQAGADDHLTWPCDLEELAVRIEVLGRNFIPQTHHMGPLILHLNTNQAEYFGETILLTRQECQLLYRLTLTPEVPVPRSQLLQAITDSTTDTSERLIDVLIFGLRKKLHKQLILSIRGCGYALNTQNLLHPKRPHHHSL